MTEPGLPIDKPLEVSPAEGDATLERALRSVLVAPEVPDAFRYQLMAKVQMEGLLDLQSQRVALEEEHRRTLAALRSGHVQMKRDTLALVVVIAFTTGACANLLVPWLSTVTGVGSAILVPVLALAIGLTTGFRVWWERFGPLR